MKKYLSLLIIIFILGSSVKVYAEEKNYNNDLKTYEFTLSDYYKYNDTKLGIETYSMQKSEIKKALYNGLTNLNTSINVTGYIEDLSYDEESTNAIFALYFDVLNENPEIFYASNQVSISIGLSADRSKITYLAFVINYLYDNNTIDSMKNKLNEKISYIQSNYLNGVTDELEKEYIIHDYIIKNATYDKENYDKNTIPNESYTAYGALVNGVAVCEGYAKAAVLLFNKANIESGIITSSAMNHAWNYVKINNTYYHLDLTWDDPVPETNKVVYRYFNLNDTEMLRDHYGWNQSLYPSFTSYSFSMLRSLVYDYGNNISRIGNKLYYIKDTNQYLYQTDLYGKNSVAKVNLGAAYMPIPYKNNIIYIDKLNITDSIKAYNINTNSKISLYNDSGLISRIYEKDDKLYIYGANGLKTIDLNIKGDIDGNLLVDIYDLSSMALKYNVDSTSSNWNKSYDLNNDNIIDIFDLVILSKNLS